MREKKLTIIEHLDELRRVLIVCLVSVAVGSGIAFYYANRILDLLVKPIGYLVFIAPQEAFMTHLKVALVAGCMLALPVILYQVWSFVASALTRNEQKLLFIFAPASCILFMAGVFFVYFLVLPVGIKFFLGFAGESLRPMITVGKYISFAGVLFIAFGIVFELPLIVLFLTNIHILTPQMLTKNRRINIISIFIISAVLTPPDVVTQLLMAIPLLLLYEIGVLLSKMAYNKKNE